MRLFFTVVFAVIISVACSDSSSKTDDQNFDGDNSSITDEQINNDSEQSDYGADNEETVDEITDEYADEKTDEVDSVDNEDSEDDSDLSGQPDESEMSDDDTSESDHVEVIDNPDGSVTVNVTLNSETDAVTSYLMDAPTSSWNYFYGSSVNIGFRVYDLLEDQYVAYHSAFRFTDVDVPAGATIENAEFSFHPTNEVDSSKKIYLHAAMEKSDDSAEFDVSDYDSGRPDQRTETDATVEEYLLKCQTLIECGDSESDYCKARAEDCWNREVRYTFRGDLTPMVQEIIDTAGWTRKNAMTIFITGTYPSAMPSSERPDYSNDRSVTGYDTDKAPSHYPVLSITFTVK